MKFEIVDNIKIWSDIYTDISGVKSSMLQRENGSISIYCQHGVSHAVIFDSLDTPPNLASNQDAVNDVLRSIDEQLLTTKYLESARNSISLANGNAKTEK